MGPIVDRRADHEVRASVAVDVPDGPEPVVLVVREVVPIRPDDRHPIAELGRARQDRALHDVDRAVGFVVGAAGVGRRDGEVVVAVTVDVADDHHSGAGLVVRAGTRQLRLARAQGHLAAICVPVTVRVRAPHTERRARGDEGVGVVAVPERCRGARRGRAGPGDDGARAVPVAIFVRVPETAARVGARARPARLVGARGRQGDHTQQDPTHSAPRMGSSHGPCLSCYYRRFKVRTGHRPRSAPATRPAPVLGARDRAGSGGLAQYVLRPALVTSPARGAR